MKPIPDHGETSYVGSGRLAGKRALITGGDSGIGRAVAIAFAREGADVAINYLPEEQADAEAVIALIAAEGRKAVALPGDVRDEAFCQQLVASAVRELGGLEILVNNAGRQQYCESIEDLTTEAFDATFKTNVYAPFWITKAAIPHLQEGRSLSIPPRFRHTSPALFCWITRKPKPAASPLPKRWRSNLAKKGFASMP
jgi:NAD(P)-dependent dehydrogenase (short-subunit alcohol dehydrogenase family)